MSETVSTNAPHPIRLYDHKPDAKPDIKAHNRRLAVEAALEIIRAATLGGNFANHLSGEMNNVGHYANIIQAALRPEE
ncbi:MAG: hypothetical protein SF066_13165 [Thermoanaerobaculia bacterium]|nr:hypothetical protein [Thermoanaerobaculia bacterium]